MVEASRWVPARGDLIWVLFDPQSGREHSGRRPAIVLSPRAYNQKVGLALLCPITTNVKGYPFEIALPGGLGVSGVILSDQIESIDWRSRRAERAGTAPPEVVREVQAHVRLLVGDD